MKKINNNLRRIKNRSKINNKILQKKQKYKKINNKFNNLQLFSNNNQKFLPDLLQLFKISVQMLDFFKEIKLILYFSNHYQKNIKSRLFKTYKMNQIKILLTLYLLKCRMKSNNNKINLHNKYNKVKLKLIITHFWLHLTHLLEMMS